MNWIKDLQGVDIYLIDQFLKGRINNNMRVLDAGCGKGRNLKPFLENEFDFIGIDPDLNSIELLKQTYPQFDLKFIHSTIETFDQQNKFDLIICNAVLHFANDHDHFNRMFTNLINLLDPEGILFIRMTSDIGMNLLPTQNGVHHLPDGTDRYLITRQRISELCSEHDLTLLDPVKSTLVENLRSMTTIILGKF